MTLGARGASGPARAASLAAMLLCGAPAAAQLAAVTTTPATPAALNIWYRSSEGCPDGPVFVTRLAELGRRATLARVGDRVDFVVTVAAAASGSSGRLERQTTRGTVAIRELEAQRCEEVTEALALSLEIALEPDAPASTAARGSGALDASEAAAVPALDAGAATAVPRRERRVLELGAQGSLARGIAPGWAPGLAVFAELRAPQPWALTGRLSLGAAFASDRVVAIDVDVLWLAARAEGCLFELRAGALSLQPCLGAELGRLRGASSGSAARNDAGVWGAALGHVRASLELDERFALEAQLGASVPLVRYALGSSLGGDLFRTEPVILALAVGGRWAP
jgi:hypothetical protein